MFDPTNFPGGPAFFTRAGNIFQAQDKGWKFADKSTTIEQPTNLYGSVGKRQNTTLGTASLRPIVTLANLAAMLAALIPYRKSMLGALIYPAVDVTGVIQTKYGGTGNLGQSITFAKTALTKMPTLTCAPDKELFGDCEWTAMLKSGASGSTPGDFSTTVDSTYSPPAMSILNRLYDTYTLSVGALSGGAAAAPFNAAPFTDIGLDDDGVVVTPAMTPTPVPLSKYGPQNLRVGPVTLEITYRPQQMTLANFYALFQHDGANIGRGKSTAPMGVPLSLVGSGPGSLSLQVPNATVKAGAAGMEFNYETGYVDRITMEANQTDNAGAYVDLFQLGVVGGTLS